VGEPDHSCLVAKGLPSGRLGSCVEVRAARCEELASASEPHRNAIEDEVVLRTAVFEVWRARLDSNQRPPA
jgi:hypothetical protein